ncbi:MAG: hypothetical protein Q8K96_03825 [Rubrivivax sp.]|nr:hypothetical protein [Rubrivivax sp.]
MPVRLSTLLLAHLAVGLGACASVQPPLPETGRAEAPAVSRAPPATVAATEVVPVPTPDAPQQEVLEATRRSVRSGVEWLARGVDGWFGDKPFREGGKVTDGRVSIGWFKRQDQSADFDVRFNAHFRLPNIEKNAYLFVGRDDPREVVRDKPDALSRVQVLRANRLSDRSFLAGLGLSLRDSLDFRLGLGPGFKPFAQVRYDHSWEAGLGHLIDFRETLFLTKDDRFGSTTALSYEHVFSPTLVARWLNAATITQVSRNFEWSSSLGAYHSLGRQRLLSLEMLFNGTGTQGTGVGLSDRGLVAKWEQPIYRNWLLCEIVGGHFWTRADAASERHRVWAFGGSLKMRF